MVALIVGAVALVLLAVEGWVLLHLVQQNGRLLLRVEALETTGGAADEAALAIAQAAPAAPPVGLPLGSPAPDFRLAGLHGETMTLDALRAQGKPLLLLFSDPGCGPCNALLPEVTTWQSAQGGPLIALISRGELDANRAKAAEHGLRQVFVQHDREVAERYQAYGTPSAVLVTPEGRVGSPLAQGAEQIRALVAQTTNVPAPTAALAPMPQLAPVDQGGQPAPGFALPDLEGRIVTLDALKGQRTAVLFWNPGCSFCQRMLDDLKEWEAKPRAGAPRLLVVSTGDVATNQGQGFASTVLLDEGFRVGQSFGASGTPSAVLVDEGGRIASAVGVGAPGVLPLLGLAPPAGDRNAGQPAPLPAAKPGQFAPPLKLPDLNGKTVRLSDFKGSKVLALFWNPGCGFCQRMLDDLKAWETQASRDKRAPKLLVISRGSVEEHRGYGLTSTIVLDQEFKLGPVFGAMGTPMGILIDAQGRVASAVAAGAEAVFALARGDALPVGD